jgi:hypothetical protein
MLLSNHIARRLARVVYVTIDLYNDVALGNSRQAHPLAAM